MLVNYEQGFANDKFYWNSVVDVSACDEFMKVEYLFYSEFTCT